MALVAGAAAAVFVALAVLRPETFMNVDGADMARSVAGSVDGRTVEPCDAAGPEQWRCGIELPGDSGPGPTAVWVVEMRDQTCWRRVRPRGAREGCVEFLHFMRPW